MQGDTGAPWGVRSPLALCQLCWWRGLIAYPCSSQDHSHLLYSTIPRMQDPGQIVEETYTMEEDPEGAMSVVSVETSDDGTTRRTETTVRAWGGHRWFGF